ncbi:MAG: glycosyltransferase family 4 protein [Anaerolineaceae bacterium]|jgi:glycosyltransferase involved in cell wall biosynthesis|nr:glycosyltransferase family 4 protein [Anaerolineaceae bacterium]
MTPFPGKVGLIQRVLPDYRAPFFNALSQACTGGLGVFAGKPRPQEMIHTKDCLEQARLTQGRNIHLLRGGLYLCWQQGLLAWLDRWHPDVLIVEANPHYLRTPAAIRWMHRRSRPVIGWGLGAPSVSGPLASLRMSRRKRFIEQFDALITYSQTGASEYAALGFPPEKIFIAANAVAPAPQNPLPKRPQPKPGSPLQVLFVGRLQARKHIDNLLQACAALPAERRPEVVIVGDGPEIENLEKLAADIYPSAVFTGALYGEELADRFRSADLFILPGTGGLAVQQAMSFGLPVIAAEADGTQADLVRPENGWQIPPNDPAVLRETLDRALGDPDRLRAMGAESYRIVAEEINLENMVDVFVKALKAVTQ